MRAPNLFLMGAMKAGSTTLARHLIQSADIQFYSHKEPALFNVKSPAAARARLEEEWRSDRMARYLMDGTVAYTRRLDDETPRNIAAVLEKPPQFIYILRNPVARTISHYFWNRQRYGESLSFNKAIERDANYIIPSLYDSHIDRYLEHFDASCFHFIKYDDLFSDIENSVSSILSKLGAAQAESLNLDERLASTNKEKTRAAYVPGLISALRANRGVVEFGKKMIPSRYHVAFMNLLTREVPREEIALEEKQRLLDRYFVDSIKRTQKLTGLNLENWLKII